MDNFIKVKLRTGLKINTSGLFTMNSPDNDNSIMLLSSDLDAFKHLNRNANWVVQGDELIPLRIECGERLDKETFAFLLNWQNRMQRDLYIVGECPTTVNGIGHSLFICQKMKLAFKVDANFFYYYIDNNNNIYVEIDYNTNLVKTVILIDLLLQDLNFFLEYQNLQYRYFKVNEDRKSFINLATKKKKIKINDLMNAIESYKRDIMTYCSRLAMAEENLMLAEEELQALMSINNENLFEEEYNALLQMVKNKVIKDFSLNGEVLSIFTNAIYCNVNGKKVFLGHYKLDVDFYNKKVKVINLDNALHYNGEIYHHPHYRETMCWGTLKDEVPRLLGRYEVSTLTMLCVRALSGVNPNDTYGKMVYKWIDANERRNNENK